MSLYSNVRYIIANGLVVALHTHKHVHADAVGHPIAHNHYHAHPTWTPVREPGLDLSPDLWMPASTHAYQHRHPELFKHDYWHTQGWAFLSRS